MKAVYKSTSLKSVGVLQVNLREDYLTRMLEDIHIPHNGFFFIVGSKDNMIFNPRIKETTGF